MPRARSQQVSLSDTPYYHCISRCVRRAFLCGEDSVTGKSFEHRRGWIEARILFLSQIFSIDICAYAVMSNHLHLVLHVDDKQAKNWSTHEVLRRWHYLHKGTLFTQQFARGEAMPEYAIELAESSAENYRERLSDISWFMRELNEPIARQANFEDECTGRFWEGRFKSQALLDEASVLACMAYVDLNPIRANIAPTPEQSEFTSIKKRVESAEKGKQPKTLYPFVGNERPDNVEGRPKGISFKLADYLQLVDLTGRIVRHDKRGAIDISLSPILQRLGIDSENWMEIATKFEAHTHGVVGQTQSIERYKNNRPRARPNKRCCRLFA
ncbi:transposase [Marinomonas sp. 15G1-11]|uniref:Transposase n=1 Tax=Marinomonas phaeophyticola TaxID=3004091 RepID=A0ABT4JPF2_9GAMM|nr:transposase [Marinomonas sp. 15G1-11]MCZ2720252.1 transposase [Marinomonas sp. 15G1-11]